MKPKQTAKIIGHKPGLITDVNENLNTGYTIFKNFFINSMGKLQKRTGWKWLPVFNKPTAMLDVNGKHGLNINLVAINPNFYNFRPSVLYARRKKTANADDEISYLEVFAHENRNGKQTIRWQLLQDEFNVPSINYFFPSAYYGGYDENAKYNITPYDSTYGWYFDGWGAVKFIDTPENLYIINSYTFGESGRSVRKFDNKHYQTVVKNLNLMIPQSMKLTPVAGTGLTPTHCYIYEIRPILNTGTEIACRFDGGISDFQYRVTTTAANKKIKIEIDTTKEAYQSNYVIGYNIYRSKRSLTTTELSNSANIEIDMFFVDTLFKPKFFDLGRWQILYTDAIADIALGSQTIPITQVNIDPRFTTDSEGAGIVASCGCYANNRLIFGGNPAYPQFVYISEIGQADNFQPDKIFSIPSASIKNPQKAIEQIGDNIFIFCLIGISMFRSTQNSDVPYLIENISNSIGCDSLGSIAVLDNVGYFISKGKMWAINQYGTIKEVSVANNSLFLNAASGNGDFISVSANVKDHFIFMTFKNVDGTIKNLWYYTLLDLWSENEVNSDYFTETTVQTTALDTPSGVPSGKYILTINRNGKATEQIMGYCHVPEYNIEVGVTEKGMLMCNNANFPIYSDNFFPMSEYCVWDNYIYIKYFTDAERFINSYPIEGIMEKVIYLSNDAVVNGVTLYGVGAIKIQMAMNDDTYTDEESVVMVKSGTYVSFNGQGSVFKIKLTHDTAENIDYDYMELLMTAKNRIKIANNVDGD